MRWGHRDNPERPDVDRLLTQALRDLNETVAELRKTAREVEEQDDGTRDKNRH